MVLFCLGISGLASLLGPQQAALTSRSSKLRSVGEAVPLALREELLRRDAGKTAAAATERRAGDPWGSSTGNRLIGE